MPDRTPAVSTETVAAKIQRLKSGAPPRLLDLFAGCGGLSLGFDAAGFEIVGAVEIQEDAAGTYARNFGKDGPPELRQRLAAGMSMANAPAQALGETMGSDSPEESRVDVLAGGPPCQAFARIGRAKLRSLVDGAEDPDAEQARLIDDRVDLYERYLHYIRVLQPVAILIENVPDMLNYSGRNLAEEICRTLGQYGYESRYTLLNSVRFGVPQLRERVFLLAYHGELGTAVSWPEPVCDAVIPHGYMHQRQAALKNVPASSKQRSIFGGPGSHYDHLQPATYSSPRCSAVSSRQALDDLPRLLALDMMKEFDERTWPRDLSAENAYALGPQESRFATLMRQWPRFESESVVTGNCTRRLPRDHKLFREMKPGDRYPDVLKLAQEKGLEPPPYPVDMFVDKWRMLHPGRPSATVTAHLGKDTYSHIHYDAEQARTISVREAARLQSFPDGFQFRGSINAAFRQIGNAVPPLLAYALARTIRQAMGQKSEVDIRGFEK